MDRGLDGWMNDGWLEGWIAGYLDGRTDGGMIAGWMDAQRNKQLFLHHISGCGMDGQTDVWMDGYKTNFFPLNMISFICKEQINIDMCPQNVHENRNSCHRLPAEENMDALVLRQNLRKAERCH